MTAEASIMSVNRALFRMSASSGFKNSEWNTSLEGEPCNENEITLAGKT